MRIKRVQVRNFRLLQNAEITLDEKTTVIVG
ncbi:AAA family ATPase [Paenibacillus sp. 2TAB23]